MVELSLHGTPDSSPSEHVHLGSKEVLPAVCDVGQHCSEAPHISGGGDVGISSEDLGRQIADGAPNLGGAVVHGGGGLA